MNVVSDIELTPFIACVIQACLKFHGSVTSWIRSPVHNSRVGGAPASKHLIGAAVDVVWDAPVDLLELEQFCLDFGCRVRRGGLFPHDHIELK